MKILRLYSVIMNLLEPVIKYILNQRVLKGKEDSNRYVEKMGIPSQIRPQGKLVWIHAVSLGESVSALSLIDGLVKKKINVLLTTSTIMSAKTIVNRLPKGVIHQYAPMDVPRWVDSFLTHWKPDTVIIMESELWANILQKLNSKHIPVFLVNARLSEKSIRRWKRFPSIAKEVLSLFTEIFAQSKEYVTIISNIIEKPVMYFGNLKYCAPLPPVDESKLKILQSSIQNRPVWIAISTHEEDEQFLKKAIIKLHKKHNNLLTIIIPRHLDRAKNIATMLADLNPAVRTNRDFINFTNGVYIADTVGEVGMFLKLCPISFIGGSTGGAYGGHNPLESAMLSSAIIQGMDTSHFSGVNKSLTENAGQIKVATSEEMFLAVDSLLLDIDKRNEQIKNAKLVASSKADIADKIIEKIDPYLN